MKIAEIMSKRIETIMSNDSIKDVARLIFGRNINGVPVCENKKLVGFITERDILAKFYPTIGEYLEDPIHSGDFEMMEDKVAEILSLKAKDIMSKNTITVSPDMPILNAQSLMLVHKVGRLPVIDEKGNLLGIVSKGDIFRAVVGKQLPLEEEEGFYDWISKYYDTLTDWKKRLSNEIPDLVNLFKKEKIKKILDIGFGTGEHAINLAREGFEIFGIESSGLMHKLAETKKAKLKENIQKRLKFLKGKYGEKIQGLPKYFDSVMFLGNTLSHVIDTDKDILDEITKILNPRKSMLVFQILNLRKLFEVKGGLRDFILRETDFSGAQRQAFLTFYTRNKKLTVTRAIFEFDGEKWYFRGLNSKHIVPIDSQTLNTMLRKIGFSKIEFYGGRVYGPLFREPFDPLKSDWLNVVAIR